MKKLLTLEIESSLIEGIQEVKNLGYVIHIRDDMSIFISGDRIGIFLIDSMDKAGADFKKIPITELNLYQESQISPLDSAYVSVH